MNVISLFDGKGCGMVALERAGIKVGKYYASEIDPHAIKISGKNYPDIIQVGDILHLTGIDWNLTPINLVIGGSPCQDLSQTKNGGKGLEGSKSSLFYEYVRILFEIKKVNPRVKFFLENVKMKKQYSDTITKILGVEPIELNSELVSCQKRKRLYWTNIPYFGPPEDKNIILNDILEPQVAEKYFYSHPLTNIDMLKEVCAIMDYKNNDIHKRILNPAFKCHTLTTCNGGNTQKKVMINGRARKLTPLEYERAQTLPDNYTQGVSDSQRYNLCGNGWNIDTIAHFFKGLKTDNEFENNLDF